MAVASAALRRDVRVIGLIGAAHFFSHVFQLALPPLFPVLREELGVGYVALGLTMSLFYAASGTGQTIAGFLVDHLGARRILLGGMTLLAGGIGLAGLSPSYWMLVPIALVAGLGNSVFHPADYSIINASVTPGRLGRAYSMHGFLGTLGFATGPVVIVALASQLGWRGALVTAGLVGLLAVAYFATRTDALGGADTAAPRGGPGAARPTRDARVLLAPAILVAFLFFTLYAASYIGVQTFSVAAMVALYGTPLALATGALTAYLLGTAGGILLGGLVADRARRPDLVAGGGMLLSAAIILIVASAAPPASTLPGVMAVAGLCLGIIGPSRDLIVRQATPPGATGRVYGFVYSGLDLGSSLTPLIFGWLLDHGRPREVFFLVAGLLALAIVAVLWVRGHAPATAVAALVTPNGPVRGRVPDPAGEPHRTRPTP
jgi:FSR family fosmidomycin resistance protein-like MFS transporter